MSSAATPSALESGVSPHVGLFSEQPDGGADHGETTAGHDGPQERILSQRIVSERVVLQR